jgi:hypothetical protein
MTAITRIYFAIFYAFWVNLMLKCTHVNKYTAKNLLLNFFAKNIINHKLLYLKNLDKKANNFRQKLTSSDVVDAIMSIQNFEEIGMIFCTMHNP